MERTKSLKDIDFSNTENAYKYLDDDALYRAYVLFSAIDQPFLAKWGPKLLQWAFEFGMPVQTIVRKTLFAHFCGGESLAAAKKVVQMLNRFHIGAVLDYAAEASPNEASREEGCQELLNSLPILKEYREQFAVFKATSIMSATVLKKLGAGKALTKKEKAEFAAGKARGRRIALAASELGLSVMVDAEESWVQDAIDEWVLELMREFNRKRPVIYHTVQLYRKDRLAYLKSLVAQAEGEEFKLGVKLVRGAYLEKENRRARNKGYASPIHDSKQATDRDYDTSLEFCMGHLGHVSIFVGTHNEESTQFLVQLMLRHPELKRDDPRIVFSQLYGMSDNISFNLAKAGFKAVKYVPYGPVKAAVPYLIRRAQENVSIQGQMGRELSMIQRERSRRKGAS